MQDIIEGNDIPLWQLFSISAQALAMLMLIALMPKTASHDESF